MNRLERVRTERWSCTLRLIRELVSAYYDDDYIIVIETLITLDSQDGLHNNVSIVDLENKLPLNRKAIRHILNRLKADGLIRSIRRISAADTGSSHINSLTTDALHAKDIGVRKDRRSNPTGKENARAWVWYIDSEYLVKVVKYKHNQIMTQLNQKSDVTAQYYKCPNPNCFNNQIQPAREWNVTDLILEQSKAMNRNNADRVFRCDRCMVLDETSGQNVSTPLVAVNANFQAKDAENELLKQKFNTQLAPLFRSLETLSTLLKEEEQLANEEEQRIEEQERLEKLASSYNFQPAIVTSSSSSGSASAAASAASQQRTSEMIVDEARGQVRLTAQSKGGGADGKGAAAPQQQASTSAASNAGIGANANLRGLKRIDHTKKSTAAPLPWDQKREDREKHQQQQYQQYGGIDLSNLHHDASSPTSRSAKAEADLAYAEQYKRDLLARTQTEVVKRESTTTTVKTEHTLANGVDKTATTTATATTADTSVTTSITSDDPIVYVQGREKTLSSLTQEDINQMTDQELEVYEYTSFDV
jgi:hypothetical protein